MLVRGVHGLQILHGFFTRHEAHEAPENDSAEMPWSNCVFMESFELLLRPQMNEYGNPSLLVDVTGVNFSQV